MHKALPRPRATLGPMIGNPTTPLGRPDNRNALSALDFRKVSAVKGYCPAPFRSDLGAALLSRGCTVRYIRPRSMKKKMQAKTEETAEQKQEQRCYSQYAKNETLDFDPLKELNLPANYEEVLTRFKKLQGERAMEALN